MSILGDKITHLRFKAKLTQREITGILGISQPTYNRLEIGDFLPTKLVMEKLCKQYKVTMKSLIGGDDMLDHYLEHLQKFKKNPECAKQIEEAYIRWISSQIQHDEEII